MLRAETRQPKTKLGALRHRGKIPAIVYGHGIASDAIFIDKQEFFKFLSTKGEGSLFDMSVSDGDPFKVILQEWQRHPITQDYLHLDFYRIRMDEKMRAKAHLTFIGEAPAVKTGGVLVKNKDYVEIECLPKDLISHISVDLSPLTEPKKSVKVRDLPIPSGVTVHANPDDIVATISEVKEDVEDAEIAAQKEKEQIEKLSAKTEEEKKAEEAKDKEKTKDRAKEKK
ncbi:MAG: 50S ribosomal protein L25 [Candidatus Jacksonbacteria bacterium]|nr:50S ribosomal protein L25 [Candidatus Jacksonbacteria bacterium]